LCRAFWCQLLSLFVSSPSAGVTHLTDQMGLRGRRFDVANARPYLSILSTWRRHSRFSGGVPKRFSLCFPSLPPDKVRCTPGRWGNRVFFGTARCRFLSPNGTVRSSSTTHPDGQASPTLSLRRTEPRGVSAWPPPRSGSASQVTRPANSPRVHAGHFAPWDPRSATRPVGSTQGHFVPWDARLALQLRSAPGLARQFKSCPYALGYTSLFVPTVNTSPTSQRSSQVTPVVSPGIA
jgi:hypothetical protein